MTKVLMVVWKLSSSMKVLLTCVAAWAAGQRLLEQGREPLEGELVGVAHKGHVLQGTATQHAHALTVHYYGVVHHTCNRKPSSAGTTLMLCDVIQAGPHLEHEEHDCCTGDKVLHARQQRATKGVSECRVNNHVSCHMQVTHCATFNKWQSYLWGP
jgi:hypothetical protein